MVLVAINFRNYAASVSVLAGSVKVRRFPQAVFEFKALLPASLDKAFHESDGAFNPPRPGQFNIK
jgi:hypothetical protein